MPVRFLPLLPGDPTEVAGYALRARLGSGGMGVVYLSFSRGGRPVAIKVVKQEFADDPEFRRRFAREISAAQQVQGHFTAPVVDADPDAPVPWLATAYIAGPSLQRAVAEYGPFPLFSVFRLLAGAAEGIAAVHAAGLIHRDLKPANVLLAEDGPRVIDFGIAHAANSSTLTGRGNAIGTPGYMAPEQIRSKAVEATDVFGLGQLAVYAATGHAAFGEGPTEAVFHRILNEPPELGECPTELRPIVERCLAKTPADRPGTAEVIDYARRSMAGDTMRVVGEPWLPGPVAATFLDYAPAAAPPPPPPRMETIVPPRPAPTQPAGRVAPPKRRRLRPALIITALVVLAFGGFLGYEVGHSGGSGSNTGAAGASQTTSQTASHAAQTQAPASPSASVPSTPSASIASETGPAFAQEWAGRQFTMPGGGCSGSSDPSNVTFNASEGPLVDTTGNNQSNSDLYINCDDGPNGDAPGLSFNGDQAAQVSGTPSAAACVQAINTSPLPSNDLLLSQLSAGDEFCTTDTQSNQLVLLTLLQVNNSTDDLTWSATAWSLPPSS